MKALFVTTEDLRRKSIVGGTVDADKFIQFIEVSQDIHIQNYLGTKLYDKIQELIVDDEIPARKLYRLGSIEKTNPISSVYRSGAPGTFPYLLRF